LEQKMANDKLRSLRQNLATGIREHVPASFWKAHFIKPDPLYIAYYRRTAIDDTQRWKMFAHQAADRIEDLFFVWKPDFEKCWPTAETKPDEPKADGRKVARTKDLLLIAFPNGVPSDATYKAIQSALGDLCKERGCSLPLRDAIARALGRRR
jgi:hypothetical protein